jgi:hypothetical protein
MTRIVVAILYAFLLGSMFLNTAWRKKDVMWTEDHAAALIGTVFLSLNVIGTTGKLIYIFIMVACGPPLNPSFSLFQP